MEKSPLVVIVTDTFLWLLDNDMLPIYCPYSIEYISSGSELRLHLFPVFRVSRAVQIFVLKISKNGSGDMGGKFTDGDLANQPVILQEVVGLSFCLVSHHYCQFQSNLLGVVCLKSARRFL